MVRGAFWSILVPFLNLVVNIYCSLDIQIGLTSPEKAMAGVLINAGVSGTSWILSIWDSRSVVASDFMVLCFLEFSFLTKFHARTMKKKYISFLLYVLTSEILILSTFLVSSATFLLPLLSRTLPSENILWIEK